MKDAFLLAALAACGVTCSAQSISSITTEIQRTPTAALYVQRATAYLTAGDARAALADADRALDRDALNVPALTVRGQANTKLGRFSNTVADLTGAIALAPKDAMLYLARAEAYAAVGDQPRAQADRAEALRLDPNAKLPTANASVATPPTVTTAPPSTAPSPAPPPVKPVVLQAAIPPAAPVTAAKSGPAPLTAPDTSASAETRYQQAKKLLDQKKSTEAIAELDEAIKLAPTNAVLFNTRGYAYYLSKDVKRALQDYDEAIRLRPDYLNATHNRALARKAAGDATGAATDRQREAELSKKR